MGTLIPSETGLAEFFANVDEDAPIVMINLLRFREHAEYPEGSGEEPCSGIDAYRQRYGVGVLPLIEAAGASVVGGGAVAATVIAPDGESWDEAILVRYPSRQAFADMVGSPEYETVAIHRTAALADSRLIATVPEASAAKTDGREGMSRYDRGIEMITEVYAGDVAAMPEGTMPFYDVMMKSLFAEVWDRDVLSIRDRRLLLMGAIAAQGHADVFGIQAKASLKRGELSPDELRECLIMLAPYAGYPSVSGLLGPVEAAIAEVAQGEADDS
jgi:alkylhydroperoxidase/carboxymuconolactone decarboxylase family protein YurZ/uncharacterized protein (DUF1330 family)